MHTRYDNGHYSSKCVSLRKSQKSYFLQPILSKIQSPRKIYYLNMTPQKKFNAKIFTTLPTQDLEYLIGFSKFFWEQTKPDP